MGCCVTKSDAGEHLWPLPIHRKYWGQLKSPIADMKNSGGRMAGATTAALFLDQYVDTDKARPTLVKSTTAQKIG